MPPQEPNTLLLFGICFLGALGLIGLLKLNHWWVTRRDYVAPPEEAPAEEAPAKPVCIPVLANQYEGHAEPAAPSDMEAAAPDIDAANAGMDWQPQLPRYPDERELVVYLSVIRHKSGKYQKSANDIAKFVGGDRNSVLRIVREVRDGMAEFRAPTPEQEATRAALGLDRR